MKINPFLDLLDFLTKKDWPTHVFLGLLVISIVIAVTSLRRHPEQRTGPQVWTWFMRLVVGGMWWQQTLWKLPPTYEGLHYWMGEMGKYAAFSVQAAFVNNVVLKHYDLFAPQVYFMEAAIATSLMLGLFCRLGSLLGALMAINLWLGLYRSPAEWPWTYFFLVLLQITLSVLHAGRSLGLDALLIGRPVAGASPASAGSRILRLVT